MKVSVHQTQEKIRLTALRYLVYTKNDSLLNNSSKVVRQDRANEGYKSSPFLYTRQVYK